MSRPHELRTPHDSASHHRSHRKSSSTAMPPPFSHQRSQGKSSSSSSVTPLPDCHHRSHGKSSSREALHETLSHHQSQGKSSLREPSQHSISHHQSRGKSSSREPPRGSVSRRLSQANSSSSSTVVERRDHQSVAVYPKLKQEEAQQLHDYELNALSNNSRRAYASDLKCFITFLAEREPALVRTPEKASYIHCLLFLNDMVNQGLTIATINRRWAFLRHHLIPKLSDPEVEIKYRHVIAGMRRKLDAGLVRGKKPIMEADLYAIVDQLTDTDIVTTQSRLLLLFLFHSAMRRSEAQTTKWKYIVFKPQSMAVVIPISKTGKNQQITIPRRAADDRLPCIVRDMERWKRYQRGTDEEYAFRKINKRGELTLMPIPIREMVRIVKDGVKLLGEDRLQAEDVACHSMRSGFCSSAADRNMPLGAIRERTRHKSLGGLQPYLRGSQVENYGI
jgi:integrase